MLKSCDHHFFSMSFQSSMSKTAFGVFGWIFFKKQQLFTSYLELPSCLLLKNLSSASVWA